MTEDINTYKVRCHTCFKQFSIQLFESHEKNLFLVDKKNWYCDDCKTQYFEKQTSQLAKSHMALGFSELSGTAKQISWAEKIRAELIHKVNFLKQSLTFTDDKEKNASDLAFETFFREWQEQTDAKWWIDHRKTTVRDISNRIKDMGKDFE